MADLPQVNLPSLNFSVEAGIPPGMDIKQKAVLKDGFFIALFRITSFDTSFGTFQYDLQSQ